MKLILATFVVALAVGRLAGGSFSNLGRLRIRWPGLALLGLGLQLVGLPGHWPLVLLMTSFVLLVTFVVVNIKVSGVQLIAVGIALNFLVIGVNRGMPVSEHAIVASGQGDTLPGLIANQGTKHHLLGPDDVLVVLADVVPLSPPIGQVVSVGDIFTYGGVVFLIVAAMRRRSRIAMSPPEAIACAGEPIRAD